MVPASRYTGSHASEYLNFLLYGFFYCLNDVLPRPLYQNALDLSVAFHLLLGDAKFLSGTREGNCDNASELLERFCKKFEEIYGIHRMVYNVHQLRHLARNALDWGPLYHMGCFYFEDFLGREMRAVKGSNFLSSQMIRKYLQDNFLIRHLANERHSDFLMGGVDVKSTIHYYLIKGKCMEPAKIEAAALNLVRGIPNYEDRQHGRGSCFPQRMLRDDNLVMVSAHVRNSLKFNDSFFCLENGSIVQILHFFVADLLSKSSVYCIVKKFASQPVRSFRLPDGTLPTFVQKCTAASQLLIIPADKLLRPVVIILENDLLHVQFAIIPPSLNAIM